MYRANVPHPQYLMQVIYAQNGNNLQSMATGSICSPSHDRKNTYQDFPHVGMPPISESGCIFPLPVCKPIQFLGGGEEMCFII